ncbi:Pyroglutamylated RFamide peptide receptor [Mizuhopecten yessoensis]|uniref:Pyroglutamylated RFamide peptide receptor n=1 Tax=Mizuhopecten yessoensis TaxID=6573 RepID=A0A210Q9G0_MIZYE|nr:Pyroglutamylated RFamide peptide receptor [Mizuhopecten yessoensis]
MDWTTSNHVVVYNSPVVNVTYNMADNVTFWLDILETFRQSELLTVRDTSTIVLLCLYIPVFLTAVIGNIAVLLVIIPNRRMWSVTNNFLLNLAIADLLVTFVCIPMTLAQKIYPLWIYGEMLCKLTPYLQGVSVTASTLTITTMSIDRCLAIRHPMKFRNVRTTKYVRIVIIVIWCVSFLLSVPILFVRITVSHDILLGTVMTYCMEEWVNIASRQVYDVTLLFIICIIPGTTILVAYLLMGKRLWVPDRKLSDDTRKSGRGKRTDSERERSLRNITRNRRRLAKLCITIAIVFIACWTPYFVINTYLDFSMDVRAAERLSPYMLLIGHVHCVTNPILYCFLHKSFRHYVMRCIIRSVKKEPYKGGFGQGYLTFNKSTPFRSFHRSSIRSASIRSRRRSSSSSGNNSPRFEGMNGSPVTKQPLPAFDYRRSVIAEINESSGNEGDVHQRIFNNSKQRKYRKNRIPHNDLC